MTYRVAALADASPRHLRPDLFQNVYIRSAFGRRCAAVAGRFAREGAGIGVSSVRDVLAAYYRFRDRSLI
jgi:hypothetical protein